MKSVKIVSQQPVKNRGKTNEITIRIDKLTSELSAVIALFMGLARNEEEALDIKNKTMNFIGMRIDLAYEVVKYRRGQMQEQKRQKGCLYRLWEIAQQVLQEFRTKE